MSIANSEQQPGLAGHRRFGTAFPRSPLTMGLWFAAGHRSGGADRVSRQQVTRPSG